MDGLPAPVPARTAELGAVDKGGLLAALRRGVAQPKAVVAPPHHDVVVKPDVRNDDVSVVRATHRLVQSTRVVTKVSPRAN